MVLSIVDHGIKALNQLKSNKIELNISGSLSTDDVAIIDEIQMVRDSTRGWAWTKALLGLCADEIHVCGEGSAVDLVRELVEKCGDDLEVGAFPSQKHVRAINTPLNPTFI